MLEEWRRFLEENWMWFVPVAASFTAPIIASLINVAYDYLKTKGWLP